MSGEFPGHDRYLRPERAARFAAGASHRPRTLARRRREREALERLLGRVPSVRTPVLDAPCGAGRFASVWADLGVRAVQVDLSPAMARVAAMTRAATARGTVFALPFPDRHFDVVLCMRFFHHLGDPDVRRRAFHELARVCNRALIISFLHPVSAHGVTRALMRLWGRRGTRFSQRLAHFEAPARDTGFCLVDTAAEWRFVREHWLARFERR